MTTKTITVEMPTGLEARPLAMLVQVASQYESRIYLESGDKKINAKSIMGMMSMALRQGESVNVSIEGTDETEALAAIEECLKSE